MRLIEALLNAKCEQWKPTQDQIDSQILGNLPRCDDGSATAAELAAKLSMEERDVTNALFKLRRAGLADRLTNRRWVSAA